MKDDRPIDSRAGESLLTFRTENPLIPWLLLPILAVAGEILEASVHVIFFHAPDFLTALFSRSQHEWWMRLLLIAPMLGASLTWSNGIRERNQHIKELEEARNRLSELNAKLALGETLDRKDLAWRLHENVAQTISATNMYLSAIDRSKLEAAEQNALRSATRTITRVMAEVREISKELQPAPFEGKEMQPAVEALAKRVMRRTGKSVDVCYEDSVHSVDDLAAQIAYRVICEVVETAAGDPRTSLVTITSTPESVPFRIDIDWDGATTHDLVASDEWLRSIGGQVLRKQTAEATRVSIVVPAEAA